MKNVQISMILCVCWFLFSASSFAETCENPTIIPCEAGMIQNAGSGTEIWNGGESDGVLEIVKTAVRVSPYSCNAMIRIPWSLCEKEKGIYDFHFVDEALQNALKYGQKLNVAVFMTSGVRSQTVEDAFCAYPLYVHEVLQKSTVPDRKYTIPYGNYTQWEPDFESDFFFERYDALLAAFADFLRGSVTVNGKTIERQKLVRCIELRHFGWWGEGAYPKELLPGNSECLIRYVDSYCKHFPNIRLLAPTNGMVYSTNYEPLLDYHFYLLTARNHVGLLGLFRDNYGWNEDGSYIQALYYDKNLWEKDCVRLVSLLRSRWKDAPVTGEPGRWSPDGKYVPYHDLERQALCLRPCVVRNCNVSQGETLTTNKTGFDVRKDSEAIASFYRFYSIIGFRYVFQNPQIRWDSGKLYVSLNWGNIGLTPTYDAWNVLLILRDENEKELWSAISSLELRTLLPDENAQPGKLSATRRVEDVFEVPPEKIIHTENETKRTKLFLRIEDPDGVSAPLALAVEGRTENGEYLLAEF